MSSDLDKAVDKALATLAKAERTRAEVQTRLESGGFEPETIAAAIQKLEAWGYLDDHRVAKREVDNLAPGIGKSRIRARITHRGVEEEIVDQVIQKVDDQSELEKANTLLKKRFLPDGDPAKAGRFLLQRGFEEEIVRTAIASYFPGFDDF